MNIACAPVLAAVLFVAGCASSGSMFVYEPIVDTREDAQGNLVIRDTPRMWRQWTDAVDESVAKEANGGKPPGVPTLEKHWELVIYENTRNRDNAQKYIDYIFDARRRAGFPDLAPEHQ